MKFLQSLRKFLQLLLILLGSHLCKYEASINCQGLIATILGLLVPGEDLCRASPKGPSGLRGAGWISPHHYRQPLTFLYLDTCDLTSLTNCKRKGDRLSWKPKSCLRAGCSGRALFDPTYLYRHTFVSLLPIDACLFYYVEYRFPRSRHFYRPESHRT